MTASQFSSLRALFLNCSLKRDPTDSHTGRLIDRSVGIMRNEGVDVEVVHALEHQIAFGMAKDLGGDGIVDEWPAIYEKVMDADILVIGTPIWLGVKSSVATLIVERLYAASADKNDRGQYAYYGKTAGCVVTGNEDGVKACSMDILYAMQHIGYTIPPQADCGWMGEAGPGPSYGDVIDGADAPAGFDNDFTNQNTTFMSWNLMHMARMLKDQGGFPVGGNQEDSWRSVSNALDVEPGSV